ncbi:MULTISPECIES: hypothetical protein [Sphingobacterium]|uniref:hypothetical protein n=1 Tax=Sphingobacterium TaxID=28453 RepID=UPI0008A2B225|nr:MULTISPECIES: hypothetical protein [Sphingobacterium]OFV10612.1 hypothetical protein HMPREF3127_21270 [Sphingobacterium sp. HMSC13C05]
MIFLVAQPSDTYFLWQLSLLINNLADLRIEQQDIHILFPLKKTKNIELSEFIKEFQYKALFFFYKDNRINSLYPGSIRPHLIKKHFKKNPYLSLLDIFYIDSDILFHSIPILPKNRCCYISDTHKYLNYDYILKNADFTLLLEMANEVGIDTNIIRHNNYNTGGAQYLLRGVDYVFWEKVEKDCINLYRIIDSYNKMKDPAFLSFFESNYKNVERTDKISPWCSDMWAVLWNLWYFEIPVSINTNMDFVWPDSSIEEWGKIKILHYTFVGKNTFKKQLYKFSPPWYDKVMDVEKIEKCEDILYRQIKNVRLHQEENRRDLKTCFVFYISSGDGLNVIEDLFWKHFKCEIRFLHLDNTSELPLNKTAQLLNDFPDVEYFVIHPNLTIIDLDRYEVLIRFLEKNKFYKRLEILLKKVYMIDNLHLNMFSKLLDTYYLKVNGGRFRISRQKNDIQIIKREFLNFNETTLAMNKEESIETKSISITDGYLLRNIDDRMQY